MGKATGFIEIARKKQPSRPVAERLQDWQEVYLPYPDEALRQQGARCMDCGIPFCHQGCPLGNLIPDWNDLVYRDRWQAAIERLLATNNFPEFTGPAVPGAVRRGRASSTSTTTPVTIKAIENEIIERAFDEGWIEAASAGDTARGKRIAVVGSGPAGLAAADQLNKAGPLGHRLRARGSHRRAAPLRDPRVQDGEARPRSTARAHGGRRRPLPHATRTSASTIPADELRREFDAIVLAGGSTIPRDLPIPGRSSSAFTSRWTT